MNAGKRLPGTPDPMHLWHTADGVPIAADAFGPPGAPVVILLHGGGQTRHAWRRSAQNLAAKGYRVVTFDSRGHGDSGWPANGDYSPAGLMHDLVCVVQATGATRPVIAGASAGGTTALMAVGDGHVTAAALILLDIVPRTERAGFDRLKSFMSANRDGFASLEEVAEAIGRFRSAGRPSRQNLEGLAKVVRLGPDGRYRWHWDPRFLEARDRDFEGRHQRLSPSARRLRVPTLLVRGGSSDVVSEEGAREFLALCPHAEYVNLSSAGHMLVGDRNDAFGLAAEAFLARHVPPGPA